MQRQNLPKLNLPQTLKSIQIENNGLLKIFKKREKWRYESCVGDLKTHNCFFEPSGAKVDNKDYNNYYLSKLRKLTKVRSFVAQDLESYDIHNSANSRIIKKKTSLSSIKDTKQNSKSTKNIPQMSSSHSLIDASSGLGERNPQILNLRGPTTYNSMDVIDNQNSPGKFSVFNTLIESSGHNTLYIDDSPEEEEGEDSDNEHSLPAGSRVLKRQLSSPKISKRKGVPNIVRDMRKRPKKKKHPLERHSTVQQQTIERTDSILELNLSQKKKRIFRRKFPVEPEFDSRRWILEVHEFHLPKPPNIEDIRIQQDPVEEEILVDMEEDSESKEMIRTYPYFKSGDPYSPLPGTLEYISDKDTM